ncbi:MAG: tetratricopeptide repeat protein [Candidatus Omnitrophota bacterium]
MQRDRLENFADSAMNVDKRFVVTVAHIIGILIVCLFAYHNSLDGGFIWDDQFLVQENEHIRSFSKVGNIFVSDLGAGAGFKTTFYRPIQMLTYTINYFFHGLDVRGYHLTNTLLHSLVALSLYFFINLLYNDAKLSFLTSILFASHPIHTEAVAYISGRADMLAALFMLLSLIFYIRYLQRERGILFALGIICYIAALLSKESSIILPALLILCCSALKKRIRFRYFSNIMAITFIYSVLQIRMLSAIVRENELSPIPLFQRIPGFFVAITNYVKLLLVPTHLHMEYGHGGTSFFDTSAIIGLTITLLFLIYAFKKSKHDNKVFFSINWFFICLLPVANIFPVNAYMAEHWLYLPSIGFFLLAAHVLLRAYTVKIGRLLFAPLIAIILSFYICLTVLQNNYWSSPIVFYRRTSHYATSSLKVFLFLGITCVNTGKMQEAINSFKKAILIDPYDAQAYNNLGVAYAKTKEFERAAASLKRAIKLDPDFADSHYNLGKAYESMGLSDAAMSVYAETTRVDAGHTNAYNALGSLYYKVGRKGDAIISFETAARIDPFSGQTYHNLSLFHYYEGNLPRATEYFARAKSLGVEDPGLESKLYRMQEKE